MQTHSITTVIPIENIQTVKSLPQCDKEKHKEMALDAAETVRQRKWYQELREQAARDIETEMH
jgi:hypothetical protein